MVCARGLAPLDKQPPTRPFHQVLLLLLQLSVCVCPPAFACWWFSSSSTRRGITGPSRWEEEEEKQVAVAAVAVVAAARARPSVHRLLFFYFDSSLYEMLRAARGGRKGPVGNALSIKRRRRFSIPWNWRKEEEEPTQVKSMVQQQMSALRRRN